MKKADRKIGVALANASVWRPRLLLREFRLKAGLSRHELAQQAGTTHLCIWNYETGKHIPRWNLLARLASVLGCPRVSSLLDLDS